MLKATLERCNAACTWLAAKGFAANTTRQYDLHKLAYAELRERFGLTAQAAVRSIAKVADAFKVNRTVAPVFRPLAAQPYDERIFRFVQDGNAVSLWTIAGRITVPAAMGEHQRRLMAFRKGEADLCFVRGKWLFACTCDVPETESFNPEDWLGVDLGIVALATDSDGRSYTGEAIEKVRSHLARRRAGLQRRGKGRQAAAAHSLPQAEEVSAPHQSRDCEGARFDRRTHRTRNCVGEPDAYPKPGLGPPWSASTLAQLVVRTASRLRRLQSGDARRSRPGRRSALHKHRLLVLRCDRQKELTRSSNLLLCWVQLFRTGRFQCRIEPFGLERHGWL